MAVELRDKQAAWDRMLQGQPGVPHAPRCERDELSEAIRELKVQWAATKVAVLCSPIPSERVDEIQKMNDLVRKLPDPPKTDVVEECRNAHDERLDEGSNTRAAMRTALRRARELWGLEPLKELEEP